MEKKVSGKHSSMNGFAMMKGRVATVVLASALLLGGGLTAQAQNTAECSNRHSAESKLEGECCRMAETEGRNHPLHDQ